MLLINLLLKLIKQLQVHVPKLLVMYNVMHVTVLPLLLSLLIEVVLFLDSRLFFLLLLQCLLVIQHVLHHTHGKYQQQDLLRIKLIVKTPMLFLLLMHNQLAKPL